MLPAITKLFRRWVRFVGPEEITLKNFVSLYRVRTTVWDREMFPVAVSLNSVRGNRIVVAFGEEMALSSDSFLTMLSFLKGTDISSFIIPENVTPVKERGSTIDKSTAKFLSIFRKCPAPVMFNASRRVFKD